LVVVVIGYGLSLDIGVLFAAALASFWGAIAGFDKLFKLQKD